ncbi:hypothetical protein SN811_16680 [Ligilactobacillus agilis]|uniref:Uncharacterized protein n=1 Tax=Ligilactobacillus agilis TaxID=1601 RepID=A0A6F9Y6W8_9LACO|nr:hypothetical protein SN811_16680 [Ligilactobacillus agilis]
MCKESFCIKNTSNQFLFKIDYNSNHFVIKAGREFTKNCIGTLLRPKKWTNPLASPNLVII